MAPERTQVAVVTAVSAAITSQDRSVNGLRIALVVGTLDVGGTETQLARLAAELRRIGHRPTVLVLGTDGPLGLQLARDGIDYVCFGYDGLLVPRQAWKALAMYRWFRHARPDICHAFLFWAYVLALPIAAAARVPVRVSARRGLDDALDLSPVHRRLREVSNVLATGFTANSNAVRDDALKHEFIRGDEIAVISNGLDIPDLMADPAADPATAVVVANLIAYKGHSVLFDALELLVSPPLVRLVGDGPARAELEQRVADSRHLRGSVRFEGRVVPPLPALMGAQLFILPSRTEGSPNAVLEAMAMGLPVIASAVGGIPELIEDGVTGILVPPNDPEALAKAIACLTDDPSLRMTLGGAGRKRVQGYAWARCAQRHVEFYSKLLVQSR